MKVHNISICHRNLFLANAKSYNTINVTKYNNEIHYCDSIMLSNKVMIKNDIEALCKIDLS